MCFFSSRRRHTRCALVTGVQTCALPIWAIRSTAVNPPGHTARLNPGGFISNQSSKGQIMQRVDCQVRLSGKLTHTVGKKNISVAEIVALRAIHGAEDRKSVV